MNKQTSGTLLFLAGLSGIGVAGSSRDWRIGAACLLFGLGVAFSHFGLSRIIRILPVVALLTASAAKAIFMFIVAAVGVGAVVGGLIWLGIAIWSSLMTVERIVGEREDVAIITVTQPPQMAARAASPGRETTLPPTSPIGFEPIPGYRLTVGYDQSVQWSSNTVDWLPLEQSDASSPMGFWRVR